MVKKLLIVFILNCCCCAQGIRVPAIEYNPARYICCFRDKEIKIDGSIDDACWEQCDWSSLFVDIRGDSSRKPEYGTRVKMLWDKTDLYIAAELQEHNIWAVSKIHDDTLLNENNFEVFIDPDGDTGHYCEIEINALNTVWDLFLLHPYRDIKKAAVTSWDIKGLRTATAINGSLNKAGNTDSSWTVEIAIPWETFRQITEMAIPPLEYDQWRINFCRTEWILESSDGVYTKKRDNSGKLYPCDFWVWSAQGLVNMHYPEMWGYLQFSNLPAGKGNAEFIHSEIEEAKWYLRKIYYAEKIYYGKFHKYTDDPGTLGIADKKYMTSIESSTNTYEATVQCHKNKITLRNDGIITVIPAD